MTGSEFAPRFYFGAPQRSHVVPAKVGTHRQMTKIAALAVLARPPKHRFPRTRERRVEREVVVRSGMERQVARIIVSHGDAVEQEVELTKPRMTIGRHPSNDIVIAHRAVSGQHAAITVSDSDIQVEDLGSTNGTFVNGQRIARQTLTDRDVIKVALHTISYVVGLPPVAAPLASIEVLNGPNQGKKLVLSKPLTTLGSPGVLVVVLGRQEERYFIRHVSGDATPLVNGSVIEGGQQFLAHGDRIDLAGTHMQFSVTE